MNVSAVTPVFQSPNYFSGVGSTSLSLTNGGTITASSLFDEKYLEQRDGYNQKKESFQIATSGRDAAIKTKISNIVSYLENGKEDKALKAYNELLDVMSKQSRYSQLVSEDDNTQLKAVARTLIESSAGTDLEQLIRENTRDNADVENQKIRTWGNCDSTSQEELLLAMCDIDEQGGHTNPVSALLNALVSPFVVAGNALFNGGKKM